ncbi:DUF6463 family protein [Roseateles cavernae]|uniref:DUF6463 family protein n=1 Tax=Roseateles cavernae TaxID=3153578 RepID=UPI0032E53081
MNTTTSPTPRQRPWIGHWLTGVAALHTVFAGATFAPVLLQMTRGGLLGSVGADPLRGAVTWFTLFGAVLALLAISITALERDGQTQALRRLGWGLLALTLLSLLLMPASGFWLVLPAIWALLRR